MGAPVRRIREKPVLCAALCAKRVAEGDVCGLGEKDPARCLEATDHRSPMAGFPGTKAFAALLRVSFHGGSQKSVCHENGIQRQLSVKPSQRPCHSEGLERGGLPLRHETPLALRTEALITLKAEAAGLIAREAVKLQGWAPDLNLRSSPGSSKKTSSSTWVRPRPSGLSVSGQPVPGRNQPFIPIIGAQARHQVCVDRFQTHEPLGPYGPNWAQRQPPRSGLRGASHGHRDLIVVLNGY